MNRLVTSEAQGVAVPRGWVLAVAVPPLVAVCAVAVFLLVERARPFGPPPPATVADAAARGAAADALALIWGGADPNAPGVVPAGILARDGFELHPIEAAILGRHTEMVALLLRQGARLSDRERGLCLARVSGLTDVMPLLGEERTGESAGIVAPSDALERCRERNR